jgi:hypothetical protein
MWLAIDEVLLNYSVISPERQGNVTKGNNSINTEDGVIVLVRCTSSYFDWPLYEVVLNSNQYLLSCAPDKEKYQRAVTLYFVKM